MPGWPATTAYAILVRANDATHVYTGLDLAQTILEGLDGHLCRCTGYVKYHEALRDVILADPKRFLV